MVKSKKVKKVRMSRGRRKIKIPFFTFRHDFLDDTVRKFPSLECLTPLEIKEVERRTRNLMYFEDNARIPYQVVNFISKELLKSRFEERDLSDEKNGSKKRKYFFKDPWDGDSMIIVREGRESITNGFNLIVCHGDAPCLRLKPKPVKVEWDDDKIYNFLGVRLSATPHGGISIHHWLGQQVHIHGYIYDEQGNKRVIYLPGVVADTSAHVDYRAKELVEDAFPPEKSLEVIVGHDGTLDTKKRLEFDSIDDFVKCKLFAVPTTTCLAIDEWSWRLLSAYGHDDRACVYSAVDAIRRARDPTLTSILWITDNEEVGDTIPSGIDGSFFDLVLDYLCTKEGVKKGAQISEVERRGILKKSSMLYGDVGISTYGHDVDEMDSMNMSAIGFGVGIEADAESVSSPNFVRRLLNLARRGSSRAQNICCQAVGSPYLQDKEEVWHYDPHITKSSLKYIGQWATGVGIPCASLHSSNEIICPGDEFWTYKFYRRFFESNKGLETNNGDVHKDVS